MEIYRAPVRNETIMYALAESQTSDANNTKRLSVIANDGTILYTVRDTKSALQTQIVNNETWAIVRLDAAGAASVVRGSYPKWIDTHRFVFMKDDGLYTYSFETKKSQLLRKNNGVGHTNEMYDISPDGKFVAWSAPDIGQLYIFTADWQSNALKEYGSVAVHGFWPVFSPDSRAVSIEAVDWQALNTAPNARVEAYQLSTLRKIGSVSVSNFDQNRLFVTDWQ